MMPFDETTFNGRDWEDPEDPNAKFNRFFENATRAEIEQFRQEFLDAVEQRFALKPNSRNPAEWREYLTTKGILK